MLGSSPVEDDQVDRPNVSVVQEGGTDYLRFSYLHHGQSSDVVGTGEYSTDLVSWSGLDTVPGYEVSTSALSGGSSVFPDMKLVREQIPFEPEAMPKVFVRLKAQFLTP